MIERAVQNALVSDSELTQLVPAERIRLRGEYRAMPLPHIVHGPIVDSFELSFDEIGRRHVEVYQVSVFAATHAMAHAISQHVIRVLGRLRDEGVTADVVRRTWAVGYEPTFHHHAVIELSGVA